MAFTRNFLKSVGLTDEQLTAVLEAHTEVTDELKKQRDGFKAEAEKIPELQKQLDELKSSEDFKAKYEKEHADFEAYKNEVAEEAETAKKKAAYRKLLADEGINEKRLDAVLRLTDFSGMKLDKDGNLSDVDKLKKNISEEWSDYKVTKENRGADVPTPPAQTNNGGGSRAAELARAYQAQKYGVVDTKGKE